MTASLISVCDSNRQISAYCNRGPNFVGFQTERGELQTISLFGYMKDLLNQVCLDFLLKLYLRADVIVFYTTGYNFVYLFVN